MQTHTHTQSSIILTPSKFISLSLRLALIDMQAQYLSDFNNFYWAISLLSKLIRKCLLSSVFFFNIKVSCQQSLLVIFLSGIMKSKLMQFCTAFSQPRFLPYKKRGTSKSDGHLSCTTQQEPYDVIIVTEDSQGG